MNRISLGAGIAVAAGFALAGLGAWNVLTPLFGSSLGFRVLIAGLAWLYMLILLGNARTKTGRVAIGTVATFGLSALVVSHCGWPSLLVAAVALVWLTRSVYSYSTLLGAVADAALCLLAVGWAMAAFACTASFAWAIWCFFLAQALCALIPEKPELEPSPASAGGAEADRFGRAQRAAEGAIRQLARR